MQRDTLADYQGVYDYQGGSSIVLVAGETLLFAVIDDAKYPLRPLGENRFLNGSGIPSCSGAAPTRPSRASRWGSRPHASPGW